MSIARRLGKNSTIYTFSNVVTKAINFLLLPLYTRFLSPHDYGIFAVVSSIGVFLSIFLLLALDGAMCRFYFEYRNEPEKLKEFWGTIICVISILCFTIGGMFLLFGEVLLKPFIGTIPFRPFVVIGIMTFMFTPFSNIYLALLQTREKARSYAIFSIVQTILTVVLVFVFVVYMRWNATGPLTAALITSIAFFIVSFHLLRNDITFCIKWPYLKEALKYSLPLVPHNLAAQISSIASKLFLNNLVSTAAAGLYNIGFLLGGVIAIIASSINQAYSPILMGILKVNDQRGLETLKKIGIFLVVLYCLVGSFIALFAREITIIFTTRAFYNSYVVVSFIAFYFVLTGIYYLLANIFFYHKQTTKLIALGTGIGAICTIVFNWWLIPKFGLLGGAVATLMSQAVVTTFVGILGRRYEKVNWEYAKFFFVFIIASFISIGVNSISGFGIWQLLPLKGSAFIILFFLLSLVAWGNPYYLLQQGPRILRTLKQGYL